MEVVLVTGAAGFLGSSLVQRIMVDPQLDRLIAVDPLFDENGAEGKVVIISSRIEDCAKNLRDLNFTHIFHFGEFSRVASSFENPEKVVRKNVQSTTAALELWRLSNALFIYAGSSSEFSEDTSSARHWTPSPYTAVKAFNANLVRYYSCWYGLRHKVLYFYNVYGDYFGPAYQNTIVAEFLRRRKSDLPLLVSSPGIQRRVFTHIDDAIDGVLASLKDERLGDFHVGSSDVRSLIDVADLFGGEFSLTESPLSMRDVSSVFDTAATPKGWKATRRLDEYIANSLGK